MYLCLTFCTYSEIRKIIYIYKIYDSYIDIDGILDQSGYKLPLQLPFLWVWNSAVSKAVDRVFLIRCREILARGFWLVCLNYLRTLRRCDTIFIYFLLITGSVTADSDRLTWLIMLQERATTTDTIIHWQLSRYIIILLSDQTSHTQHAFYPKMKDVFFCWSRSRIHLTWIFFKYR